MRHVYVCIAYMKYAKRRRKRRDLIQKEGSGGVSRTRS